MWKFSNMKLKLGILVFIAVLFGLCKSQQMLPSVFCGVQNDVILETDPVHHQYIPFLTKLPRCGGIFGMSPPNIKRCVKSTGRNVSYNVMKSRDLTMTTIQMEHHVTCKPECVVGPSSCDTRYQTWDADRCRCNCKYASSPAVSPCPAGKIWKQATCSCACPSLSRDCPDKKEWNDDVCGCTCTKRYLNRCSRKMKVINQESCSCMEPPTKYINSTAAARGFGGPCDGVSTRIVIMIVVLEFLFLVAIFFFMYRCCLRYDPDLDPNISSLKRMKYEVNKTIKRLPGKNKEKTTTLAKTMNGNIIERPVTPTLDTRLSNLSNKSFTREESKELTSSDHEVPVNLCPDAQDSNFIWESATSDSLESGTPRTSIV